MASPTVLKLGFYSQSLTGDSFVAHPSCPTGVVIDLNDGATLTIADDDEGLGCGLDLGQPQPTVYRSGNPRTTGQRVVRRVYDSNRIVQVHLYWGPTSTYTAWIAALSALQQTLEGISEQTPAHLQIQVVGASTPIYVRVKSASMAVGYDEVLWMQRQTDNVVVAFECSPFAFQGKDWLQNLVSNPGFEAVQAGTGFAAFTDTFANANAYASQAGSAPTAGSVTGGFSDLVMSFAPSRYYRMSEPSGTTGFDVSSKSQHGTYVNAPTLGATSGVNGETSSDKAVTFASASSQRMSIPVTGLPTGNAAMTFMGAVNIAGAPAANAVITEYGTTGTHNFLHTLINSSRVPSVDVGTGAVSGSALSTGAWHLIFGVWDGTTLRLYVDGSSVGTPTTPGAQTIPASATSANIAASVTPGSFLSATIDEVAIFPSALSAANITALWNAFNAGTGLPTVTNTLTVASGARIAFGSPGWSSTNHWWVRLRYVSGLTARFYLHYVDASNWLRATVSSTGLSLDHNVAGVTTNIGTGPYFPAHNVWYWLDAYQTVAATGAVGGNTPQPFVNVILTPDLAGTRVETGATYYTAAGNNLIDGSAAQSGRPQIEASGASLVLGGPYSGVHAVNLYGPGGWSFAGTNSTTGQCSAAWEQNTANTYTGGPITSFGAARVDFAPAGTISCQLSNYTGGAPAGTNAIPVRTVGDVMAGCCWIHTASVGANYSAALALAEYDASGSFLRSTTLQTITGTVAQSAWTKLSGTVTTGANCAWLQILLTLGDSGGTSYNATSWIDSAQVWNQTQTGKVSMAYCELRFPQSWASLVISGVLGTMPAAALFSIGMYINSWSISPANSAKIWMGRRGSAASGILLASVPESGGPSETPTNVTSLNSSVTTYGGYDTAFGGYCTAMTKATAAGAYHLMARVATPNASPTASGLQSLTYQTIANNPTSQAAVGAGPAVYPFSTQNFPTVTDMGRVNLPPFPYTGLTDTTQLQVQPGYGSMNPDTIFTDAIGLMPVDGEKFLALVSTTSSVLSSPISQQWLYVYADGTTQAVANSLESKNVARPDRGTGNYGNATNANDASITIRPSGDTILRVDPTLRSGMNGTTGNGVNQFFFGAQSVLDGAFLPTSVDVIYWPHFLLPA